MAILKTSTSLTAQVVADTVQASQAERMEHGGATYGARKVKSKGRTYTQLTINDTKTMRKHRYFFSVIRAIGGALKRLFRGKSVRPYLDGRTAHLRKDLTDADKKALSAVKLCGTGHYENLGMDDNYGVNTGSIGIVNKSYMDSIVTSILGDFGVAAEEVAVDDIPTEVLPADTDSYQIAADEELNGWAIDNTPVAVTHPVENLVPENGFYEIQLATCMPGLIKEPHAVSLVIDPLKKQFYLMDTKGANPENLHFYYGMSGSKRVSELTVGDLVTALKENEKFSDFSLTVTPSFQKVGDCVASAEAMTRCLAAVRQNLIDDQKLDKVGPNYEIMAALATVYENYEKLVTEAVRARLET